MPTKNKIVCLLILFNCFINNEVNAVKCFPLTNYSHLIMPGSFMQVSEDNRDKILEKLNSDFVLSITSGDTVNGRRIIESILQIISEENADKLILSDSKYYIGVYYLLSGKNEEAIKWLGQSSYIRKQLNIYDLIHSKCFYNIGLAYHNLGDFKQMEEYTLRALEIDKKLIDDNSQRLLKTLSNLVIANFGLNQYKEAIDYGDEALKCIHGLNDTINVDIAALYENIGICYARLSDYSKAILYLEKSESIFRQILVPGDVNYINLLNNIAATYFFMGLKDRAYEFFNKGFEMARNSNSILSLNFLNSFGSSLGNAGKIKEGQELILNALEKALKSSGPDSKEYNEMLRNYAEYLRTYGLDLKKSRELYEKCLSYVEDHDEDVYLKNAVILGYSLVLAKTGDPEKALDVIQNLLFSRFRGKTYTSVFENPDIGTIEADMWSLDVLKAKYGILRDMYSKYHDYKYLEAASETSELIVALLEAVRINISEEDSRLILGDRFRESYLFAIRDFDQLYKHTGNEVDMKKAFEYSEKSKVAGLLTSTRELKATQFHIPQQVAGLERKLKSEISLYNAKISTESTREAPDKKLLSDWKNIVFNASRRRDSLITYFEKQYPEYYMIKYNTEVIKPEEITRVAGRNVNYLNYVVSDTVIYIFLTNRKYKQIITVPVDSGFFRTVREFRELLSMPSPFNNAKKDFIRYQESGLKIYRTIFEPVRKYLISDRLLISPDNILAFLPFETIPVAGTSSEELLYGELPYLMKYFRISYAYSATVLAESLKKGYNLSNRLVAFAPVYTGRMNVDSLLLTREPGITTIQDLPYARQEAEFVSKLTRGTLFLNNKATESAFKREAGEFDIIHLAMHTILNDQNPMHSKMLFYQAKDSSEDGNLNTYEVYNIPLRAKMVILSSCNSGSGILNPGEGILSLARGFTYSGSQSVIMSMWEIEDRSGTEIVKSFYRNLKRGDSKSKALRKARLRYLDNADMLRSHPYFWASLVIYGNDKPLYNSGKIVAGVSVILLLLLAIMIYFRRFK